MKDLKLSSCLVVCMLCPMLTSMVVGCAGSDSADTSGDGVDAGKCKPEYDPPSTAATEAERAAVQAAASAFKSATGVDAEIDATTAAVAGFSGPFSVALDPSVADACDRAFGALKTFLADHAAMMRMPPDIEMRACNYDSLLDKDVLRLHGGTYAGRSLLVTDNDLVVHVTRKGEVRYWGGNYMPLADRPIPTACNDAPAIENSVIGDALPYLQFEFCVPGSKGSTTIAAADTRTAGAPSLYVDNAGFLHVARQVKVLLDASRVTVDELKSDLYCCVKDTFEGCVGKHLIVDEITLEILGVAPLCITC